MNSERIKVIESLINNAAHPDVAKYLTEYADLLEAIDKAEPVAWVKEYGRIHSMFTLQNGTALYAHPPKQEQSPIDERAEFDKWAIHRGFNMKMELSRHTSSHTVAAFAAWQARAKLSAPVVPDAKDEIDHEGIWTNTDVSEQRYIQGWNDCRAAMLKGEK